MFRNSAATPTAVFSSQSLPHFERLFAAVTAMWQSFRALDGARPRRFFFFFFFLNHHFFFLSSSTRWRFYPQRSSGQAVVTGVVSSPRYVPSFLSSIRFSIPTAVLVDFHRVLLTHAPALSANNFCMQEKVPTSICTLEN